MAVLLSHLRLSITVASGVTCQCFRYLNERLDIDIQLEFLGGTKYSGLSRFDFPQYTHMINENGRPLLAGGGGEENPVQITGIWRLEGGLGPECVVCLMIFRRSSLAGVTRKYCFTTAWGHHLLGLETTTLFDVI
jgi:hypothetical protein